MIAWGWIRVYLPGMAATGLLRFLTVLAVLFAQLGMLGEHAAAMPAPAAASMSDQMLMAAPGHCADTDEDQHGQTNPSIDCMIACSSLPSPDYQVDAHPTVPAPIQPADLTSSLHGLHPESDPPPPRTV